MGVVGRGWPWLAVAGRGWLCKAVVGRGWLWLAMVGRDGRISEQQGLEFGAMKMWNID